MGLNTGAARHVGVVWNKAELIRGMIIRKAIGLHIRARRVLADERGQGTTEYAILVGVLVVIAIIAVTAFRGKIQELWNAISDGINGL